jgi:hypothetical protein
MFVVKFVSPGLWLMRRLRLAGKLALLLVFLVAPTVMVLGQYLL